MKNHEHLLGILDQVAVASQLMNELLTQVKGEENLTPAQQDLCARLTNHSEQADKLIGEYHKAIAAEKDQNAITFDLAIQNIGKHYEASKDALSNLMHSRNDSQTEREKNYNIVFRGIQALRDHAAVNLKNHLQP